MRKTTRELTPKEMRRWLRRKEAMAEKYEEKKTKDAKENMERVFRQIEQLPRID